jgi:uncharacterized protein YoaH (UPF0181 family)
MTADAGKKLDKEKCVAKCMAQGMTREEAEACVAKMIEGHTRKGCSPEECIAKCMAQGMSREEAEACVAKMSRGHGWGGCRPAKSKDCNVGDKESYTKKECISYYIASGMTKEQAEAKYVACIADGKCSARCRSKKATTSLPGDGKQ